LEQKELSMRSRRFRVATVLMACGVLAACDSTEPGSAASSVAGTVVEAGGAPAPPLAINITMWTATGPASGLSRWLATDPAGDYEAYLEAIAPFDLDSVRIEARRFDCGGEQTASVTVGSAQLPETGTIEAPALALSYRLPAAQIGAGASFCAAVTDPPLIDEGADLARLAIWIDDMSDSVRGRWRLNHSVSIGDDYGEFSGTEVETSGTYALHLHLRPTQPTGCSGLDLVIPTISPNSSVVDVSTVTGDGTCTLPSGPVRFFDGAVLSDGT
jgi:hypothetical protein